MRILLMAPSNSPPTVETRSSGHLDAKMGICQNAARGSRDAGTLRVSLKGTMDVESTSGKAPARLLHAAKNGDAEALGRLLEPYRSYLRLLARLEIGRHLRAKIGASDIVQETFLQAHRAFGDFRGTSERQLLLWLRRILASRLSKGIRRYWGTQRRDILIERELDKELGRSSAALDRAFILSQTSPSGRAVRRERAVLLADAIDRLPADYQEVIVLHHLQNLTFPEVAQAMDRSAGSVEKLWMRALARLRTELGGSI